MAPLTDNSKRTDAAIEAHYRFLAWLVPTLEALASRLPYSWAEHEQYSWAEHEQ